MSETIAAVIGVLLGLLVAQIGRAALAWREVTAHDEESAEQNRRLLAWVDDRTYELVQHMTAIANNNAASGLTHSGINGGQLAQAKALALHQHRDQRGIHADALQALRTQEGMWHLLWRLVRRRPAPSITVDGKIEPFLNRWREPVTRHSPDIAEDAATPLDRTTRTYEDALRELPSLKLT